ncbi:hypothetical protein ROZALSC1DRAFT_12773 [Rozella allomycis CSF55]|nr:hypothetical protein ROZALSC1DRAFT_12773 [Rozella allomycis CSF55]
MKQNERKNLRIAPSRIQGYGLFSNINFKANDLVIEYVGELIGQKVADKRESYYDKNGIGCYMFRLDDDVIIDATRKGNAARFINHSCKPNCHAKISTIEGTKKVIIYASKNIYLGDELTYDYKFAIEDEKIPCNCGAPNCRKFMN